MADISLGAKAGNPVVLPVIGEWTTYTPVSTQGWGAVTTPVFQYVRVGSSIAIRAKFVTSSPDGNEARVSLPTGLTSATTNALTMVAAFGRDTTAATANQVYIENGVAYLTFGRADGTVTGMTKRAGNVLSGTGETISFTTALIPITEWAGSANVAYGAGLATSAKAGLVAAGQVIGSTRATATAAGYIGERLTGAAPAGTFTTGVSANVSSIAMTSGIWLVYLKVPCTAAGTTKTDFTISISQTSATLDSSNSIKDNSTNNSSNQLATCTVVDLSASATIYAVVNVGFTGTTPSVSGGQFFAVRIG